MTDQSNFVYHHVSDDEFIQEDTFLRKKSVFTGYDHLLADQVFTRLAFPTSNFGSFEATALCSYISFLSARSLTAGRYKTLTAEDWLEMLTLKYFIDAYKIYSWEAAELILDGQSPGDFSLLEEMEWVGDHLQTLLDREDDFHFPQEGDPITLEMSRHHDDIISPLKSIIAQVADLESLGVNFLQLEVDPLDLITSAP